MGENPIVDHLLQVGLLFFADAAILQHGDADTMTKPATSLPTTFGMSVQFSRCLFLCRFSSNFGNAPP
jgi:hypothetical protein